MNAPIATENPKMCANNTKIKQIPNESTKSSSCDLAANLKRGKIKNLFVKYAVKSIRMNFPSKISKGIAENCVDK